MVAVGDRVRVLYSECKGFGAEKVGQCGTVTRVEPLRELVGLYRVQFPDGAWEYLDREVERDAAMPRSSGAPFVPPPSAPQAWSPARE
jgi:hypothetical protein